MAWQQQAIAWNNVDFSWMEFCSIHLTRILQESLKISIHKKKFEYYTLKITATSARV